ncbi:MAG: VWA domain-containing protein [Candidatus Levybacteria bacterium]|nr:VWA domain-containing protein [Candidatus Levybacteria bacterium]
MDTNPVTRVWQLLTGTSRARTLSFLALLILVAVVPLTLSLTKESTDLRQRAAEPTTTGTPGGTTGRSITCSPTSITLTTQEQTLTATFRNAKGETPKGKTILWRSSLSDNQISISNKSPNTNRSGVVTTKVKAKNQNAVGKAGTVTAVFDNDKNVKCTTTLLSGQGGGGEPSAAPTPTPTVVPVTIPPGIGQSCPNVPTASMLIIDRSNSMARPAGATRAEMEADELAQTDADANRDNTKPEKANSKFRAAKEAAKLYVDTLSSNSQGSKIGVVSFANEGRLDTNFSSDFPLVKNKITDLKMKFSTCIVCAVNEANKAFATNADQNLKPVVILLTDGIANYLENSKGRNLVPHDRAEKATLDAVRAGYAANKATYYVIGLGKDVNANFLKQIAQETGGKYYSSPSTEQLNSIYQEIASLVGKGSISGYVFSDVNGNKTWDKGGNEKPLLNWTVYLKDGNGTIIQQTTSDDNGYYIFTKVCNGTYTISEEVQPGWTVILPPNNRYDINMTNGSVIKDQNFGNKPGGVGLQFDIILHGVGSGGDTPNPNISTLTNKDLKTPVRELNVQIFDTNNIKVVETNGPITYNQAVGNFTGSIDIGNSFVAAQAGASANNNKPDCNKKENKNKKECKDEEKVDCKKKANENKKECKDDKKKPKQDFNLACEPETILLTTQVHPLTVTLTNKNDQALSGKKITWEVNQSTNKVTFSEKKSTTTSEGTATTNISVKDAKDNGLKTTITAKFVDGSGKNATTKAKCEIKATEDGGGVGPGVYTIKVKTQKYLRTLVPGTHNIKNGEGYAVPQFQMVAGDVNGDNLLNVLDYNILTDCYSDLKQPLSCPDPNKKFISDLTDDGKVNAFDYNLFIRELPPVGD